MNEKDFCRVVNWYPVLGEHSAVTVFMKLSQQEVKLLANGIAKGPEVKNVVNRLKKIMRNNNFSHSFISTDYCSPTDTERFAAKHGAVHSAESAWFYLASSQKVREEAKLNQIEYLAIRPFLKIDHTLRFYNAVFHNHNGKSSVDDNLRWNRGIISNFTDFFNVKLGRKGNSFYSLFFKQLTGHRVCHI